MLLIVIITGSIIEFALGATSNSMALIDIGANLPVLIREGQWARLFTANFLHIGILHIYFNGLAILILGVITERMIGS